MLQLIENNMLYEIRENDSCYSDAKMEVSTYNQDWDETSLKELRDKEIFFMSNNVDSVTPIKLTRDKDGNPRLIEIGIEDDGTLFFGNQNIDIHVMWIDSLINELQAVKEYISK